MSDSAFRELERRWRQTGAVGDEAAYLLARVRVGNLASERLALAAYCGHAAARLALGDRAPNCYAVLPRSTTDQWDYDARESFRTFLRSLLEQSDRALVWAALACGWFVLPAFEAAQPNDLRPRRALEIAEACLMSPSSEGHRDAAQAADDATLASQSPLSTSPLPDDAFLGAGPPRPGAMAADLAGYVCRLADAYKRSQVPSGQVTWDHVMNDVVEMLNGEHPAWPALAASVADRVAAWALGRP